MESADAQTTRRGFAAWNDGRFDEFLRETAHLDIVLYDAPELPDAAIHRGFEAYKRRLHEYTEPLGQYSIEVIDLTEQNGAVLVEVVASSLTPGAGVPMSWRVFNLFRYEDGKVIELRLFLEREQALAAVAAEAKA